jgi:hypothetical protein
VACFGIAFEKAESLDDRVGQQRDGHGG